MDLTKYIAKEETITVGTIKLKIKSKIPDSVYFEFSDMKDIDTKKPSKESYNRMTNLGKSILIESGNSKEDVEKVFSMLDTEGKTMILSFIAKFTSGSYQEIKTPSKNVEQSKKKDQD